MNGERPGSNIRSAGFLKARSFVIVFFSILLLLPAVPAAAYAGGSLSAEEIGSYMREGEEAFRKGMELDVSDPAGARDHYNKAILNFELVIREGGVRNGRLFYNTGNAWFRLGDLGKAILYYKRAGLYRPNDENLRQNLEYARSRRINRVEATEKEKVFKTLFFLHYDISSRVRLIIFMISFAMIWIAATLRLFFDRSWVRTFIIFFVSVSAIFMISLGVEKISRSRRPAGVIVSSEVTARKGDAGTYQQSFTEPLYSGTEFILLENRTDWLYIELEDGARCWIPSGAGELVIDW
ncbi:MAG: tetratricopeptide repeat protein [Candidatus Krumholzibacteriota bacterium]|nr:tetratricopeptide repeat protein [Candidatus Krumholzibacteriota bacterium]